MEKICGTLKDERYIDKASGQKGNELLYVDGNASSWKLIKLLSVLQVPISGYFHHVYFTDGTVFIIVEEILSQNPLSSV